VKTVMIDRTLEGACAHAHVEEVASVDHDGWTWEGSWCLDCGVALTGHVADEGMGTPLPVLDGESS
jgi:hypothetical protein